MWPWWVMIPIGDLTDVREHLRKKINSQSLEDTQIGYISQKYTLDNYTLKITLWLQKAFSSDTEISVKKSFWGPVEWVGDQLTGWGGSSQKQNLKINGLCFFYFFYLSDRYWDFCKKQFLGTSWMGWGPVEWVGDQLTGPPRIKIRK